jgi:hypothetical protein
MITTLPAVQRSCKKARTIIRYQASTKRADKRIANRRYRRVLNAITRALFRCPEDFDNETFDTPSLSPWDIW